MFYWNYVHNTRQSSRNMLKPIGVPRLDISHKSFRWRSASEYNRVPANNTSLENGVAFKKLLRKCIQDNVSIRK